MASPKRKTSLSPGLMLAISLFKLSDRTSMTSPPALWCWSGPQAPLAIYRYFYKSDNPEHDAKKKNTLETFIDNVAYEPDELDLYRKENIWFSDAARLGTAFVKVYPDKRIDVSVVGYDDKTKKTELETSETYNGPSVDNLDFEEILCDPMAATWEKSRLKCHIRRLSRHEIEERVFAGFYDKEEWEKIRNNPDRHGPEINKQRQKSKQGINVPQASILAEWDIYECWFWWYVTVRSKAGKAEKVKVELVWSYHEKTRSVLRRVFNFMPHNAIPMIPTKLSISDKGVYGRGYAEMLENSQEEVSTIHNQRIDARTMGITGFLRSSNPNLDKNITVFPFAVIPASKDELEWFQGQEPGQGSIQDEELTLRLAAERAGVGPAIAGMGAGGPNKKGQYGSMGTLAVMQDGNSRVNHRVSDFRHSHVKLLSTNTDMYAEFGTGRSGSMFGLDDKLLEEALSDFRSRKSRIPIRAATASANKEVDKQNKMLLRNALAQHNMEQIKLIQAISGPQIPPPAKQFMMDVVKSQDAMMKSTLRDFGFDNPDLYVPEMKFGEDDAAKQQRGPQAGIDPRAIAASANGVAQPLQQPGVSVPAGDFGGLAGNGAGPHEPTGNTR